MTFFNMYNMCQKDFKAGVMVGKAPVKLRKKIGEPISR